ncbi:MAG: hypothetical protein N2109_04430 [Fimbriimonadales bacterium]|nr:hypothetical protein [Fimbriimonadales bacterium]
MRIQGLYRGEAVQPLRELTIAGDAGPFEVSDARGRIYHRGGASFLASGTPGWHTVRSESTGNRLQFRLEAATLVQDGSGRMAELFDMLRHTLFSSEGPSSALWNGKVYRFFVGWLRDHVHTLKGMRYFADELKTAIELYRDSQRHDGMIWDNYYPRGEDENYWIVRFTEGGFYRAFEDKTGEFKRIPVENDVEYLFVEGIYNTWKATGDDAWMLSCLDSAVRALAYTRNDKAYRWSEALGLPKRGYTIDTWDFQSDVDSKVEGDPMRIRPGTTRFGAMFGDATGYAMGCRMLAEMLDRAGRKAEAEDHRRLASEVLQRLDQVAWLGTHYRHHVPEDPSVVRDFGVDEASQVSLSNAYSINRGIPREHCRAIVNTYRRLRENLPKGSPGEWYTIWPPFQRGFEDHCGVGQYMNGSVTPIVAGELSRGAFEAGEEAYGADILDRLTDLGRRLQNRLYCSYTGWFPPCEDPGWWPIDLAAFANADIHGKSTPGVPRWPNSPNDLREFPVGRVELGGVPFCVADPDKNRGRCCVSVSDQSGYPSIVRIPVGRKASSLVVLHTVSGGNRRAAGELRLCYEDGSEERRSILFDRDITHWWMPEPPEQYGPATLQIVWKGSNPVLPYVAVCACVVDNPNPDKPVAAIELRSAAERAVWHVIGLTLADRPFRFPPPPISFGIPDGWGAAAVVYALIEGLAGIVCDDPGFESATLSPRWLARGETEARVCAAFPACDGYAAYAFEADPEAKAATLTLTGSGDSLRLRLLVPAPAVSCKVNGAEAPFASETVGESHYVVVNHLIGPGPFRVEVRWA